MMPNILILLAILALFTTIFVIVAVFLFFRRRKQKKYRIQDYSSLIPKGATFEFLEVESISPKDKQVVIEELKNLQIKERLQKNGCDAIYLIHGTFVGDDPWHIFQLLKINFPKINEELIDKLKNSTKKSQDVFAGDLGNFTNTHVDILSQATEYAIPIYNFNWSSGNHHLARLIGAMNLLMEIRDKHQAGDKILLIGHSHAGQLFSLMTLMMSDLNMTNYFLELIREHLPFDASKFNIEVFNQMKKIKFDFITLGTPPRYTWELPSNVTIKHIINHRGRTVIAGTPVGAITTKDGDYIQQWGIEGSDILPPSQTEKNINEKLDYYLGKGSNLNILRENIAKRKRLHNKGHHFLVDYHDDSKIPNFLKTVFGHGYYTKIEYLPFLFNLILPK